jgi:hypothetical protein
MEHLEPEKAPKEGPTNNRDSKNNDDDDDVE